MKVFLRHQRVPNPAVHLLPVLGGELQSRTVLQKSADLLRIPLFGAVHVYVHPPTVRRFGPFSGSSCIGNRSHFRIILYWTTLTTLRHNRTCYSESMPVIEKAVRRSVALPRDTARRVTAMAQSRRTTPSRLLAD